MFRNIIYLLLFLVSHESFSDHLHIQGRLLTANTLEPIAYANIGILDENIGTISNPDGTYMLKLDSSHINEIVIFSALGYEKKSIEVNELGQKSASHKILLNEKDVELDEITIKQKLHLLSRTKHTTLGNLRHNSGIIRLDTSKAGSSVAVLLHQKMCHSG